jgi:hypothetical protein
MTPDGPLVIGYCLATYARQHTDHFRRYHDHGPATIIRTPNASHTPGIVSISPAENDGRSLCHTKTCFGRATNVAMAAATTPAAVHLVRNTIYLL